MYNKILECIKEMDDCEVVSLWNEYCYTTNHYDDEILTYDSLKELISNDSQNDTIYWLNRFFFGSDDYSESGSANPNRNYFTFNGYGNIISFDYIYNEYSNEFSHIDIDDLVAYIVENCDSLYNDDIQAVLDADCEEEEI